MRILFLGAGATGGYFGGRLAEAGQDVTFLLRKQRAGLVAERGLVIRSPAGDATLHPRVITDAAQAGSVDYAFLTCKAYDLASAMDAIAPAIGNNTTVVPLLNGLAHYDALDERFGHDKILGGFCAIHAMLDEHGGIHHWGAGHRIRYGEREGDSSARVAALEACFANTKTDHAASDNLMGAAWEKWIMLASMAGVLCLMRADVATVMAAPGGCDIYRRAVEECRAVAVAASHPPREKLLGYLNSLMENPPANMTASMLRDLRQGHRVEADHILGDLIRRAEGFGVDTPVLRSAYCHLKCYEALRSDSGSASAAAASGNNTSV